jgi:hypothetical protein
MTGLSQISGALRENGMPMCRRYAGKLPINLPTISPLQAPLDLLGRLPPMMLVIGSSEVLLGDNLQFVQMVAQAGGAAQLEVRQDHSLRIRFLVVSNTPGAMADHTASVAYVLATCCNDCGCGLARHPSFCVATVHKLILGRHTLT